MDGIYSPVRTAVFIGKSDTQTEEWREGNDKEWIHRVTDRGMLIENRAMDGGGCFRKQPQGVAIKVVF